MNLETVFPHFVYYLLGFVFLASVVVTYRRYSSSVRSSYLMSILSLRSVALILTLLFGLQPFLVDESVDSNSFSVSVLVDSSASMETQDCAGESRLKISEALLKDNSAWLPKKTKDFNTSYYTFASGVKSHSLIDPINSRVGGTNIEDALNEMIGAAERGSLGGVVLISDGQENNGTVINSAKRLKSTGVPVTVIGVGGEKELTDVELTFDAPPKSAARNKEFELIVKVQKNTAEAFQKEIVLSSEGIEVGRQIIDMVAGKDEKLVSFNLREYTAGFKNYRASIDVVEGEMISSNNVDYTAVDVTDDNKIKILYFSANLSWEYKFLDKFCDDSENLHLTALIRTGDNNWYYYAGREEKKFKVFPESTELIEYDVIVFDLGSEYLLTQGNLDNLEKFSFDKGGGIIFTGRQSKDSKLTKILPLSSIKPSSASGKKVMKLSETSILLPRSRKDLTDLSNILYLKSGKMYFSGKPNTLKVSARAELSLRGGGSDVVLSSLYYGAGRTLYLGAETWPWKMNPDNDGEHYDVFWKRLFTWASSSSVEQLKIVPAYKKFAAGEAMNMAVDLLDPDFEPSLTAVVEVIVKSPSGKVNTLKLPSSLDLEGRYELDYIPDEVGEYSISVNSKFADDTTIAAQAAFLSVEASGEKGTLPVNRRLLEDIARITGGKYIHWDQALEDDLPLSEKVPVIQSRSYPLNNWVVMVLILALFCGEWFMRRRVGLR